MINPEIEIWLWLDSEHVANAFGWPSMKALRDWLQLPERKARDSHVIEKGQHIWNPNEPKPRDPKEARLVALEKMGQPQSPVLFRDIARKASFTHCTDPAFLRLCYQLRSWFPPDDLK